MTQRHMTEGDRARDARLKAAREGGGVGVLPGVEKEGEEPKTVGSCHHPELSSASELRLGKTKKKNPSLFLTCNSPPSMSQHQSALRSAAGLKRHDMPRVNQLNQLL